ncbi:MAG TPA: amidohydrolase family protein [Candidatus Solibacter sp.]
MRRLLSLLLFSFALGAQPTAIVIRGARVVDGTGAPAREATVVIRGSRIEAVGANADVPAGARVIDATGQTLLPGLFDLHTHLSASAANGVAADWGKNLKAYLASGVTTVNDYATYGEMFAPMRQLLKSGATPGPHVNMAVRMSTPGGHGTEAGWGDFMTLTAATPAQAHAQTKIALAYKPDLIKVFTDGWRYGSAPNLSSMNLETLAAIVEDAHAANVKVVTHTVTLEGAKIAARAGVDILVHGIGDADVDTELIELMKAKHTAYVSTLAVYEYKAGGPPSAKLATLLDPGSRATLRPQASTAVMPPERAARWKHLTGNVERLFAAGIPIGAGTDAGMPGTFHGYASLRELELLVESGLSPLAAITAATGVSARVVGVDADRGTIAAGKAADLVLVDGRPDERIVDIEKTRRVFLGGVEVALPELEKAVQSPEMTVMPAHSVDALVDDMERTDGRTRLGTLRVNGTDAGVDHSQMIFQPVVRSGHDHAMLVTAAMAAKDAPFVRLELPLTPGGIELADVSGYAGVTFEVRGEGEGRLVVGSYHLRNADGYGAPFPMGAEWKTVKIPFAELRRKTATSVWDAKDGRALYFDLSASPSASAWMELDNVRFY